MTVSTSKVDKLSVVVGAQWGDEGKGKLVDMLAQKADICARCQGGNNAGHTIVVDGVKYDFHLIPSGLISPTCTTLLGNGLVIHLPSFFEEIANLEAKGLNCEGRIFVSDRAHLVFDFHQIVDGIKEVELGRGSIGTTKKGIGPAYSSKASRSGIRVHHLYEDDVFESRLRSIVANRFKRYGQFDYDVEAELKRYRQLAAKLKPMVVDSVTYMHASLQQGKNILVEGANAIMLDIDFGTYPFVTSSNTGVAGVCTGLGVPPNRIGDVIGVVKAYTTRVGEGPFPTEQLNSVGETLQDVGHEYGTTTGRKRRCGWLDLVLLKYSHMVNGYTSLNLTKLDVLDGFAEIKVATGYRLPAQNGQPGELLDSFPASLSTLAEVEVVYETLPGWQSDISNCRTFEELPVQAQEYVRFTENYLGVPIDYIGVGVSRTAMINCPRRS
ncbi:Adenylosuccinate synthase [Dimargaris cristalligena]|uniref:Adenylosuccinate synthetase n=1 Tax=Dimargaris cristalligena TaxID=215637 RepID=A0A4V1J4Z7_9FUNG|nr:Adenylosuccinate synthase [Dimargaris cristalligena]RKP37299.1 Adenylosuccinate synthetase [Dimargaris cristalligena]|eukprot:RKP37299.1 Adenylosuccinate synthetase [Dimargaris cristalligena]